MEPQAVAQVLRGIPLFKSLRPAELNRLASLASVRAYREGATIVRQDDTAIALYCVLSGKVRVARQSVSSDGEVQLAEMGSGGYFGEMSLLDDFPRSATVVATEPCRVLILSREQLYPLFQNNPVIAVKFLWNLSVRQSLRLDEASEWLSSGAERAPDTIVDRVTSSPFSRRQD